MSVKNRGGGEQVSRSVVSHKWTLFLCLASFSAGLFFTNRTTSNSIKRVQKKILQDVTNTENAIQTLDKTISDLETELAAAKAAQESISSGSPTSEASGRRKYFMVIGINTAFSSRKRRDSVRATWMPQGEKRKKLESEKGIIVRFVIGHSVTLGGILDRAVEAEDKKHGDIMRLDHVEGYLELSAKTKTYFATAVSLWDAEYYVKVDDDVHVNIATLGETLARHRKEPRVYVGCMKSGPVLAQRGVRYHEPEFWKFGEPGNKYFRHATGQLYAISKDLATYISVNQHVLHKYANEDVSLGSWFIGLDVRHIDDRRLCCGTPPDCEWKAQAGNICVASFDWTCSGICRSVDRIKEVHRRCGEGEDAVWKATF
ncbi:Beta-1,3-galactosyltransferase 2 [Orobanche hederae]